MASASNSQSSICGIDLGTENCYVAIARQGGIEILLNEYSQRSTPAYIAFGGNQRELGVSAKQKQMMNLSKTCFAPSLIIGKQFKDLNLNEIPYNVEKNEHGEVSVRVFHNGEELVLTATQVLAMIFTKLRNISGNPVDCVINCPNYFNDTQRRALIDAALIAGLNPLKIISDMTAVALYYGFYRSSASGQDISIVGFVNCGQTSTQASVVMFNYKENYLRVLDAECEPNVGGKHFDEILANQFINQQKLELNKRARYRLIAECEKVKKQMSANSNELPVNIECLYNDKDFTARIDRATFEQISQEMFNKIQNMLSLTYKRAQEKYTTDFAPKFGDFKIDSVEIVGGTSRIPAIKKMITEVFGVDCSTTLNADEAVARGCALQCAILSPTFKVSRELQIIDSMPFQLDLKYDVSGSGQFKTYQAFYPRGHHYPFTKQIAIPCQKLPIAVAFDYVLDSGESVPFAKFNIGEAPNSSNPLVFNESVVKFRVRIDENGLVNINNAVLVSKKTEEKAAEEPMDQSEQNANDNVQKMETDENDTSKDNNQEQSQQQQESEEPKRKLKAKTMNFDLVVEPVFIAGKCSKEQLQKYIEIESNLILADKNWKEKTDARNALEEFIYEWRDRLESGGFDIFIDPESKANFQAKLEENEKWLYEQDEQEVMHSKSVYDEKNKQMLNDFASPVIFRKREFENRPSIMERFGRCLQQAQKLAENPEPEEAEEIKKLTEEIVEKQKWFDGISGLFANMKTFDYPPVNCDEISKQASQLDSSMEKIHRGRKRRADERRQAEEKRKAEEEAAKKQAAAAQSGDSPNGDAATAGAPAAGETKMEVDGEQPPPTATKNPQQDTPQATESAATATN